jgi:hypothetical protein
MALSSGRVVLGAGEIVANDGDLRRFSDQPVAEIVQCGEPRL